MTKNYFYDIIIVYMSIGYKSPEPIFGDPEYCYGSSAELIVAVASFPGRFSNETHALVAELISKEIAVENYTTQVPDQIELDGLNMAAEQHADDLNLHPHYTQPTQS